MRFIKHVNRFSVDLSSMNSYMCLNVKFLRYFIFSVDPCTLVKNNFSSSFDRMHRFGLISISGFTEISTSLKYICELPTRF